MTQLQDKLLARSQLLTQIRAFFASRQVLEVETPLLCPTTITASYLHSFRVDSKQSLYLQTSPEFAMKKLLAQNSGDIYQICKAFRDEERGKLHNPEFTILEWYRVGYNHHQLMDEMAQLLSLVLQVDAAERFSYAALFEKYLNLNPHLATITELRACAAQHGLQIHGDITSKDAWLQLLLANFIEPHLGQTVPTFIYDYPASQAALAKIRLDTTTNIPIAERFEVYVRGVELANGFHELNDPLEQRQRFEEDLRERQTLDLPAIPIDEEFLELLAQMPPCAGVALGVDRLLMLKRKGASI